MILLVNSPDALVQSSQFSHQLCSTFVLVAAEVVHCLYGLGGRLQLVFIDVHSLVLGLNKKKGLMVGAATKIELLDFKSAKIR